MESLGGSFATAWDANFDGSVIVGGAVFPSLGTRFRPARWENGVFTQLAMNITHPTSGSVFLALLIIPILLTSCAIIGGRPRGVGLAGKTIVLDLALDPGDPIVIYPVSDRFIRDPRILSKVGEWGTFGIAYHRPHPACELRSRVITFSEVCSQVVCGEQNVSMGYR